MWPHYDTDQAVLCLNSYLASESQGQGGDVSLSDLNLGEYAVAQVHNSRQHKIVSVQDHEQELVVKIVGILCSKTLPPFRASTDSMSSHHRRKLRQHVKISGGGSPAFDDYELKLNAILDFFGGSVGTDRIEVPEVGIFDGHYAVDFHTRYFEERRYAPDVPHIPFDVQVDPTGALEKARGTDLVHGEQNIVEYCVKTAGESGVPCYEPHDPQEIAIGDIVEVCATFTLFPFRKDEDPSIKYKLVHGLRSLSVLNHDYAKAMRQVRTKKPAKVPKIVMSAPKRKYLTTATVRESKEESNSARSQAMDQD